MFEGDERREASYYVNVHAINLKAYNGKSNSITAKDLALYTLTHTHTQIHCRYIASTDFKLIPN